MSDLSAAEAAEFFRQPPQALIDVGAGGVAYRRIGSGPDVLFVHGFPVSGATWRGLLPELAPHVTCHVIDLPGAGASVFDRDSEISLRRHVESIKRVVDELGLSRVSVVGHDSGGLMARHALAGDERLRSMVLINTEQSQGVSWRFRQFILSATLPGFLPFLGWAVMRPTLRRNPFLLGDCFADRSLLDGEFEEFFLKPLHESPEHLWAAGQLLETFDTGMIDELSALHAKTQAPVKLIWGDRDPFFPVAWAREMVATFPDASLDEIAGAKLFPHEERPQEVAQAMLPTLLAGV
jgi:pimeloyl-ACP methyl ester carboxylesterase